jgi:hypothetical protein
MTIPDTDNAPGPLVGDAGTAGFQARGTTGPLERTADSSENDEGYSHLGIPRSSNSIAPRNAPPG